MANPSALGAITYEAESSWGEDVTTFTTLRLPVIGAVDASGLKHDKIDPQRVVQYRNDGTQWILGVQGGTFKTRLWLTGHGSATTGATTASGTETLLGKVFGNVAASAASGTTTTGGTAAVPTTTASGTLSAGSLCRIGTQNDAKGNGQFLAIATHVTTTLNMLTALDGAPGNGDVLYDAVMVYPSESPTSTSVTGLRFLLQTANLQYECHGVFPSAVSFGGLNTGETPYCEVTWTVSWWRYSTATFPNTATTETFQPSANAGGSLFVNDFGTATRAKRTSRNFTLDYRLGMVPLLGPGGIGQYQAVVGARRIPDQVKLTWTEDADAATTTPILPGYGTATTDKHVLYTLNPTATKSMGMYFPRVCVTNVAIQKADGNINRLTIEAMAYTSTTTTNDLTLSCFRMGFA